MNTEDKLDLIGICQKLVPLGAVELADDLEEIIDKQIEVNKKKEKIAFKRLKTFIETDRTDNDNDWDIDSIPIKEISSKYKINSKYGMSGEAINKAFKTFPSISKLIFSQDFSSIYPYNELKMVDNWIFQLKLMQNYFTGFGKIETQNSELNQFASSMRSLLKKYRKKMF